MQGQFPPNALQQQTAYAQHYQEGNNMYSQSQPHDGTFAQNGAYSQEGPAYGQGYTQGYAQDGAYEGQYAAIEGQWPQDAYAQQFSQNVPAAAQSFSQMPTTSGGYIYPGQVPSQQAPVASQPQPPAQMWSQPSSGSARRVPDCVNPCHYKFMSLTVNSMPASQSVRTSSKLPLGVVVQPLAESGGPEISVVNFGAVGVVRCKVCRAYINPYVMFTEGGSRWMCNICGRSNEVPSGYFAALDAQGRRVDIMDRPELRDGTVEIVAPAEYMMRQPMPPTFVFVIDVSRQSVASGMLQVLCDTVRTCLAELPGGQRTQIGFITFDSAVHFYSLRANSQSPQMFVVTDLEDVFPPCPADLLVNLDECRAQVDALLQALPFMHQQTSNVECAFGAALEAAVQMMGHIGGKALAFLSGLPSIGPGRLANRDDSRLLNTPKEHVLQQPADDFYKKKAVRMSRFQICADTFLFGSGYTDFATISEMSRFTAGQIYHYPGFTSETDGRKFSENLRRNLTRQTGWEAVVRVRASEGIKVENVYGNLFLRGADLLALPAVDCDKAIALEFKNEDKPLDTGLVSVQAALLYSTSFGERRIRVHTICVPAISNPSDLYTDANSNAIINLVAKQAVERAVADGFAKAREFIRTSIISAVRAYRTLTKSIQPPNTPEQLPEHLSALPIMCLGLLKTPAFREGTDIRSDDRTRFLTDLRVMGLTEMETFVRPRMLPVHSLSDAEGLPLPDNPNVVYLPNEVNLSAESLTSNSALLIDNGMVFCLRLGRSLPPQFLKEVFDIDSLDAVFTRNIKLRDGPGVPGSTLYRIHNILAYLRSLSPSYQNLLIFKEGDPTEVAFYNLLIEDRSLNTFSLNEFLHHVFTGTSY